MFSGKKQKNKTNQEICLLVEYLSTKREKLKLFVQKMFAALKFMYYFIYFRNMYLIIEQILLITEHFLTLKEFSSHKFFYAVFLSLLKRQMFNRKFFKERRTFFNIEFFIKELTKCYGLFYLISNIFNGKQNKFITVQKQYFVLQSFRIHLLISCVVFYVLLKIFCCNKTKSKTENIFVPNSKHLAQM